MHGHGHSCDAESEACRSPSPLWDDLFLVPRWSLRDSVQPCCSPLGSRLPLVHPGGIVVCSSLSRPPGQTASLASLGQAAHRWNGIVLRFAPDCTLRGQWKVPAALERPSPDCILAGACSNWNSPYRPRIVVASAGTSSCSVLVKGALRADHNLYFHYSRNMVDAARLR